jgi:hypothetical protein
LLDLSSRLERLEMATVQVAEVAVTADAKASVALENDAEVAAEVAEVREEVAEAAIEEQAPAEADEAPARKHWLHR